MIRNASAHVADFLVPNYKEQTTGSCKQYPVSETFETGTRLAFLFGINNPPRRTVSL